MAQLLENILRRYFTDPASLEADLFNDLAINRENIQESCFQQPYLFAKWAILTSMADTIYRNQKRHVAEEVWPQASMKARNELTKYGGKVTVGEVEHLAMQDPSYQAAKKLQADYGSVLDIIKRVESAFWHRKSMLESLSTRIRREEYSAPKPQTELEEWASRCGRQDSDMSFEDLEAAARDILRRRNNAS